MDEEQPRRRERKPLTEVGIMATMEASWDLLGDRTAEQRVALYFCSRAGFDIRPLLLHGNGEEPLTS